MVFDPYFNGLQQQSSGAGSVSLKKRTKKPKLSSISKQMQTSFSAALGIPKGALVWKPGKYIKTNL